MLRWYRRLTRAGAPVALAGIVLALVTAGVAPAPAATSQTSLLSTARATTSGAVTLTISRPNASPGSFLLAALDVNSASATVSAPSGWTLIRGDSVGGADGALSQFVYYRFVGPSEPSGYMWSSSEKVSMAGAILAYGGIDATIPIDVHSGAAVAAGKAVSAPAVSTSSPSEIVVGLFGDSSGRQLAASSPLTERFDAVARSPRGVAGPAAEGADALFVGTGSTGAMTASSSGGATVLVGQVIALRRAPAASDTPTPPVTTVVAPANTTPPAISGTAQVGQTLTTSTGSWTGTETPTYAYQWRQCDAGGANCVSIAGATSSSYALASGDAGHTLRVTVTATNSAGHGSADSMPSAVVSSAPAPAPAPTQPPAPTTDPSDRWFGSGSPFNTPISAGAEPDPGSQAMVQSLVTEAQKSGWPISVKRWSTPVYYADSSTPKQNVSMTASWAAASTLYGVPVPAGARPDPSSDGHMAIINRDNGCYYEFYSATRSADGALSAGWGNRELLGNTGVYPHSWSTRDSGFANFAGMIRPEELQAGVIDHALTFSTMYSAKVAVPPASAWGGAPLAPAAGALAIPYGARVQLDPSLNLDSLDLTPWQKIVARALQQYGMYMADTGGFSLGAVNPQGYATNPYIPFWGDGDYAYMPPSLVPHLRVLKLPAAWSPDRYVINDSPCGTLK
jgi:hypothetical protein